MGERAWDPAERWRAGAAWRGVAREWPAAAPLQQIGRRLAQRKLPAPMRTHCTCSPDHNRRPSFENVVHVAEASRHSNTRDSPSIVLLLSHRHLCSPVGTVGSRAGALRVPPARRFSSAMLAVPRPESSLACSHTVVDAPQVQLRRAFAEWVRRRLRGSSDRGAPALRQSTCRK